MNQIVTLPDAAKVPAYTIETWPLDRLKPYERNARKHSKKQIEQLRGSFRKFGQVWPFLVREDGTIIAGHGRYDAAKAESLTEVRVIVATGWTEKQCRAFGVLDNKLALNSEWDEALLGVELTELGGLGVDLESLGFDPKELDKSNGSSGDPSQQLGGLSYAVVVRCKDETHQGELLEKLEKEGLTCEALIF